MFGFQYLCKALAILLFPYHLLNLVAPTEMSNFFNPYDIDIVYSIVYVSLTMNYELYYRYIEAAKQ